MTIYDNLDELTAKSRNFDESAHLLRLHLAKQQQDSWMVAVAMLLELLRKHPTVVPVSYSCSNVMRAVFQHMLK